MAVHLHPHARARLGERGATEAEVISSVEHGEQFAAKFGRTGFRRDFAHPGPWRGRTYSTKRVEAYAVLEGQDWLVITIVTKYF